jgi:flagellar basal-body rod protein FlgF
MDRLIYTAMTGASATMGQEAAVAHNLANATSTGFKAELHRLRAVPVQNALMPTRAFVVDASVQDDLSTGPLQHTNRPFDVAVQGKGWFAVQMPDGTEGYTRNGNFEVSANGILQTRGGLPVMGSGGPITVPPTSRWRSASTAPYPPWPRTGARNSTSAVDQLKLVNPPEADLRAAPTASSASPPAPAPADPAVGGLRLPRGQQRQCGRADGVDDLPGPPVRDADQDAVHRPGMDRSAGQLVAKS